MRRIALWALATYKRWISPALPPSCRYVPTCSEYASEAIERYGIFRGGMMAAWRLLRCHPFVKGGYDPVKTGTQYPVPSTQEQSVTTEGTKLQQDFSTNSRELAAYVRH